MIGRLVPVLEYAADQPLNEDVRFLADPPVDIASAAVTLVQESYPAPARLDCPVVLNGQIVGIRVPMTAMAMLPPDQYALEIQAVDATGASYEIRGTVRLLAPVGACR